MRHAADVIHSKLFPLYKIQDPSDQWKTNIYYQSFGCYKMKKTLRLYKMHFSTKNNHDYNMPRPNDLLCLFGLFRLQNNPPIFLARTGFDINFYFVMISGSPQKSATQNQPTHYLGQIKKAPSSSRTRLGHRRADRHTQNQRDYPKPEVCRDSGANGLELLVTCTSQATSYRKQTKAESSQASEL